MIWSSAAADGAIGGADQSGLENVNSGNGTLGTTGGD